MEGKQTSCEKWTVSEGFLPTFAHSSNLDAFKFRSPEQKFRKSYCCHPCIDVHVSVHMASG